MPQDGIRDISVNEYWDILTTKEILDPCYERAFPRLES